MNLKILLHPVLPTLFLSLIPMITAHANMAKTVTSLTTRQVTIPKTELLADLKTLPDSALSPAGRTIKSILLIDRDAVLPNDITTVYKAPGPLGSKECRKSTCCIWKYIADDMSKSFKESKTGECNELARQAVRLGFHDAATWSKTLGGGGADGSIILAGEWTRSENLGLEDIAVQMKIWYGKWRAHGAGMADLIQMAANVATVSCPLGPRVKSFVGRNDSSKAAPEGRLPKVDASAKSLVALFEDKTVVLGELIALIGAHTTSRQRFVDKSRAGAPQDSTPGIWDVKFYNETISGETDGDVFRFESDVALARYSDESRAFWETFASSADDQGAWNNVSIWQALGVLAMAASMANWFDRATLVPMSD